MDSEHQTITADYDLRIRTEQKGPDTGDITQPSAHTKGIRKPAIRLPGKWSHDVLTPTEHYHRPERLSTSAGQVYTTRSENTEFSSVRTSNNRHPNTSTVSGTRETGAHPTMKNHEAMQYLVENLQDTTTQVISLKFNKFDLQSNSKQQQ